MVNPVEADYKSALANLELQWNCRLRGPLSIIGTSRRSCALPAAQLEFVIVDQDQASAEYGHKLQNRVPRRRCLIATEPTATHMDIPLLCGGVTVHRQPESKFALLPAISWTLRFEEESRVGKWFGHGHWHRAIHGPVGTLPHRGLSLGFTGLGSSGFPGWSFG